MDYGLSLAVLPAEADVEACRKRYFHYNLNFRSPHFAKFADGPGHPRLPGKRSAAFALNDDLNCGTGLCIEGVAIDDESSFTLALTNAHDIMRTWAEQRIAEFPNSEQKAKILRIARTAKSSQEVRKEMLRLRAIHEGYILNDLERDLAEFDKTVGPFLHVCAGGDQETDDFQAVRMWRFIRDCLDDNHTPWIGLCCAPNKNSKAIDFEPKTCIRVREITPRFLEVMDTDRTWFFVP